jgi:hypothetical protein
MSTLAVGRVGVGSDDARRGIGGRSLSSLSGYKRTVSINYNTDEQILFTEWAYS